MGRRIAKGKSSFKELEKHVLTKKKLTPNTSGRQEVLESLFNDYL